MSWSDHLASLDAGVAEIFDEQSFRLLPQAEGIGPNHKGGADSSRAEFDFKGSLDLGPPAPASGSFRQGDPAAARSPVFFDAVLTAHTAAWPYMPRRGDLVRDQVAKLWKIADFDRDGSKRLAIHLTAAK